MSEWQLVRLELGRTPDFPAGSASRAFMLRVPLADDGRIDEAALRESPALATVRRFWPDEPDQQGYLVHKGQGWAFSYVVGEDDDEDLYHLELHPIRSGEYLTISEPDGRRLPYRVVRVEPDGVGAV